MPVKKFTKTTKKTKRTFKRKPQQSLASKVVDGVGGFALKVLKNKLGLNTETKFLDTIESAQTIGTTMAALAYPLQIPQGADCNSRNGSDIRLTSYELNLTIIPNVAAITPGAVRFIAMTQKDSNGSVFGSSDIMSVANNIRSPYNMNSEGYTILVDKVWNLSWGSDQAYIQTHISIPLGLNHHLKFLNSDTLGNVGSIRNGYVRCFLVYEGLSAGQPTYSAHHRVKFVDN